MRPRDSGLQSILGPDIEQFLAHKRSLGRRYDVEEKALALFDDYLVAHRIGNLTALTPTLVNQFLCSRPTTTCAARSHGCSRGWWARGGLRQPRCNRRRAGHGISERRSYLMQPVPGVCLRSLGRFLIKGVL